MQDISLGQRIRELRLKKGITQIELAKGICTPSMISQIESDRARPSYKILTGIAERFEIPLEQLLSNVNMQLETVSNYKMSRAMVAAGEYASAIPLLRDLLDASHGLLSITEVMFDLGICYLKTNELETAEQMFEQVQELAVLRQDHYLAACTFWNSGVLELQRKKNQLAVYKLKKSLRETEGMPVPDALLKGNVLFDLGRALERSGELEKAVNSFVEASQHFETSSNWHDLAQSYLQLSKSYKQLGEFEKAIAYSERATALFEGMQNAVLQLKVECEIAALLGESGQLPTAVETLQEALPKFLDYGEHDEAAKVCLLLVSSHLKTGNLKDAKDAIELARSLLPDSPLHCGRILHLEGQIALMKQEREEAINCFKKAAVLLKEAHVFSEWEIVIRDLAELYHDAQDDKRAFELMDEARSAAREEMRSRGISL